MSHRNGELYPRQGPYDNQQQQPLSRVTACKILSCGLARANFQRDASCRSLKVLVADIDYIMLGMPGTSLSDSALNTAGLPSVKEMLQSSRKAARLFKPDPHAPHPGKQLQESRGIVALVTSDRECFRNFSESRLLVTICAKLDSKVDWKLDSVSIVIYSDM